MWTNPYVFVERPEIPGVTTDDARIMIKLQRELSEGWEKIFEDGADAMLETLRKRAITSKGEKILHGVAGVYVFIPDDRTK